jgi:hypothetical protein
MTTTKRFGLLGLLGGLALILTTAAGADHGRPPKRSLVEFSVFDGKDFFGQVVRDGDRFVALRALVGEEKLGYLHNFEKSDEELWVDDRSLGYDLRGKNKDVLVRERSAEDTRWEFVSSKNKEEPFRGRFRAKNGELKGWWIGLGAVEPGKKGSELPRDQYPRARLILVKDTKDAAGLSWSLDPPDDGR